MKMEPKLKVVEKPSWANPEEVEKAMRRLEEYSRGHRLSSVVIIAEQQGGGLYVTSSRTEDKFKLAAALMMMAIEMMGFVQKDIGG